MATKGFTKVDNLILLDTQLSLEAKGLYAILKHLSAIPNFSIRRDYVKSISGYGETAFRRVWKELKDKGILMETKLRDKGKYVYTYTLKTNEDAIKPKAPVEERKPKHIDSDGNVPLNGQVSVDDVMKENTYDEKANASVEEAEKALDKSKDKNVEAVSNITGFNKEESKELLKLACNDISKIIKGHEYVMSQEDVRNVFSYTKWAVKNNKAIFEYTKKNEHHGSTFNAFKQRTYDFEKLKKALLYGEPYELPA